MFFLAVIQILTSRTNRDYFFMAMIAFLELLAAAILSSNSNFFLFLALYLLFAMAAFTSAEIRRSMQKTVIVARTGRAIPSAAGGVTTIMPRHIGTDRRSVFHAAAHRGCGTAAASGEAIYMPGFSNQVTLGEIGEIKTTSRPVMHIHFFESHVPADLKWRGATLSDFNGRAWFEGFAEPRWIGAVAKGVFELADDQQRRKRGRSTAVYRVNLNNIDSDVLFLVGRPD